LFNAFIEETLEETFMKYSLVSIFAGLALLPLAIAEPTQGRITRIEIVRVEPAFEGQSFGAVGPFEHVTGRAHGEVDPGLPENSAIQDIRLAPRKAPANRDALTTLQLRDANTSSSSFRCRPTLFFIPASDCDAMLRPGRLYGIELPIALFDAAGPLVPGNRSADMVRASTFACSGDFLLRLAGCQGKDLIVEAWRVAAAAS